MKNYSTQEALLWGKRISLLFLLLAMQQSLMSQDSPVPLAGNLYGQPIVASGYLGGYRYVATASNIYESSGNAGAPWHSVYTPPAGSIAGFTDLSLPDGNYRAVLLSTGFLAFSKILAPAADSIVDGIVQTQARFASRIAGSSNKLYVVMLAPYFGPFLFVSQDRGQTWNRDTIVFGSDAAVYDIATDTRNNLYLLTSQGLYEQLENDSNRTLINATETDAFEMFIDSRNRIILNSDYIAVISLDGGSTFNPPLSGYANYSHCFANNLNGDLLTAGSDSTGNHIYRYLDNSLVWQVADNNLNTVVNPAAGFSCFSGDSVLTLGTSFGAFNSIDGGQTWLAANQGVFAEDIYAVITLPDGRLLCTTDLGIFYKDVADSVWHQTYSGTGNGSGLLLYNDRRGNIFAAYPPLPLQGTITGPLAKSIDGGLTWAIDSIGFSKIYGQSFYIDETGTQHFFNANGYSTSIWSRAVGGSTWTKDTLGLPLPYDIGICVVCSDQQGYLYAGMNSYDNADMYRRAVNGTQWVADTAGLPERTEITSMASSSSFGIIAVSGFVTGTYSSLYRRANDGWVAIPTPTDTNLISAVSIDDNGVIYVADVNGYDSHYSNASDVYFTKDTGLTWSPAYLAGMKIQVGNQYNFGVPVPGGLVSYGNNTYALTQGNGGYVFTSKGSASGIQVLPATFSNRISVFPNPSVSGQWTIQSGDEWIGGLAEVSNMNGKVVYHDRLSACNTSISLPEIAAGVYVYSVSNAGKCGRAWLVK